MCNQVRGFHRGARKFIAKTQMTFPNCADINLFAFIYTYFQAKLNSCKVIGHPLSTIHMSDPNSKSSNILSDCSLTDILKPAIARLLALMKRILTLIVAG